MRTTRHGHPRVSLQVPLFSLQLPSSVKFGTQVQDLNMQFSLIAGHQRHIVCWTNGLYPFWYLHTSCCLAADYMTFTIHMNRIEADPPPAPF